MRVALVHHWLLTMRGGEKVLEAIAQLYPEADIFTLFYDPKAVSKKLRSRRISASWLNGIPLSARIYRDLLPLYPSGCRSLDLSGYDLVISSDSSLVKGVRVPDGAVHICYCHSPPRYLWGMSEEYLRGAGFCRRAAARFFFPRLKRWDKAAAGRVDHFIANSENVKKRISRFYGRKSTVIYPPVTLPDLLQASNREDYYLCLGQLVSYKRIDLAVLAANESHKRLVIIGEGPEMRRLRKLAGPTVEFLGRQPDEEVHRHLANARALLFPGEEDFGMVPVEALGAGCPVIAYGCGGAFETVTDGITGILFDQQTPGTLSQAMRAFEARGQAFSASEMRRSAERFSEQAFLENLRAFVQGKAVCR